MSIDEQTARKVARLSRLAETDEELTRRVTALNGILKWIEQLGEVNTDGVEPLANVADIDALYLRADEVTDGNCPEKVLSNAPEETQGYYVVPKVVE